ncbi:MAG: tetratricopeptide repeat protein, partial [Gammaproteobacteria bacterium]|nr:tetratricopeptide repeat protein [Gammaproteobacteria bacterium]
MRHILITIIAIMVLVGCGGADERKAAYLEKARISMGIGDLDKARIELKNVLQIDPKNAQAYFLMGDLYDRQKDYAKAF